MITFCWTLLTLSHIKWVDPSLSCCVWSMLMFLKWYDTLHTFLLWLTKVVLIHTQCCIWLVVFKFGLVDALSHSHVDPSKMTSRPVLVCYKGSRRVWKRVSIGYWKLDLSGIRWAKTRSLFIVFCVCVHELLRLIPDWYVFSSSFTLLKLVGGICWEQVH